jgi:tRNA dimethylallyltransferase
VKPLHPFVLIVGPTASGKSALALDLALKFKAGILNCDSLQTYKRLDIGTAKPTPEERNQAPHFLFDVLAPGEVLTAGDFRRLAMEVLERELPKQMIFGVGGSGFYIQALEKGMFDVPKPKVEVERVVREEIEEKGKEWAYNELKKLDPEYAEDINPNDTYRIGRALIIIRDSGKKVSELRRQFARTRFPFPLLKLGLAPEKEELLPRIEARTAAMLKAGFLDEVKALMQAGWADWAPLQSVGYRECRLVLDGELAPEKLGVTIVEKTMQLAKKQKTWFKRDSEIHWLDAMNPLPEAQDLIAKFLAQPIMRPIRGEE